MTRREGAAVNGEDAATDPAGPGGPVGQVRVPMSWEEFLDLGESVRGEYDGQALVPAAPRGADAVEVAIRIAKLLRAGVAPPLRVGLDVDWPGTTTDGQPDVITPGVAVYTYDGGPVIAQTPLLVVDVVGDEETQARVVDRQQVYLRRGVTDVWVVDLAEHEVRVYAPGDGVLGERKRLGSGTHKVAYSAGHVVVDVDALLDMTR